MEKQLVPKLRFSEFEGTWRKSNLGNELTLFNGYAFSSSDSLKHNGVLWVKIADVGIDKMKTDNLSYLPYDYVEKHKKFLLNEGDYVVALTRPILGSNLKIAKIDKYFNNSLLNQRVAKLITDNNSTFIYNLLKVDKLIKSIENNIAGSDPPNLSPKDINHIKIKIPTLPEQQKIASFLTDVDTKITQLTKKETLLEQYKKGVMQKIFNQELRFKDDNGNDFPKWEVKKLGEVAEINKGTQLNAEFLTKEGDYPCISGGINPSGYTEAFNKNENTITISEGGNSCGYVNFFKTKFWCGGHCYAIENLKNDIHNDFLFQLLKQNEINIMRLRVGSGLPNIQKKDINNFKLKFPASLIEQTKIANFLSDIDKKTETLNTQIEHSKTFKKGLLQQMFV